MCVCVCVCASVVLIEFSTIVRTCIYRERARETSTGGEMGDASYGASEDEDEDDDGKKRMRR